MVLLTRVPTLCITSWDLLIITGSLDLLVTLAHPPLPTCAELFKWRKYLKILVVPKNTKSQDCDLTANTINSVNHTERQERWTEDSEIKNSTSLLLSTFSSLGFCDLSFMGLSFLSRWLPVASLLCWLPLFYLTHDVAVFWNSILGPLFFSMYISLLMIPYSYMAFNITSVLMTPKYTSPAQMTFLFQTHV